MKLKRPKIKYGKLPLKEDLIELYKTHTLQEILYKKLLKFTKPLKPELESGLML